jgi:hypothetical protein
MDTVKLAVDSIELQEKARHLRPPKQERGGFFRRLLSSLRFKSTVSIRDGKTPVVTAFEITGKADF